MQKITINAIEKSAEYNISNNVCLLVDFDSILLLNC